MLLRALGAAGLLAGLGACGSTREPKEPQDAEEEPRPSRGGDGGGDGGDGGGGACLLEDSLVVGADGDLMAICHVEIGDQILSLNRGGKQITLTRVTEVLKDHPREGYYAINGELRINNDHPVLAINGEQPRWVRAEALAVGDTIRTGRGLAKIETIERVDEAAMTVYLATAERNFLAAGKDHLYVMHGDYRNVAAALTPPSFPAALELRRPPTFTLAVLNRTVESHRSENRRERLSFRDLGESLLLKQLNKLS